MVPSFPFLVTRRKETHLSAAVFSAAVKPGLHVPRKHKHKHKRKHKKPTCKPVRRKHKRLVLALVLMLASSRFTRTTQRRKLTTSTREWNDFHSLVLVLMLASLRRTCKPKRRKHKHERKERKMKNGDKLSAYNLVTHARSCHSPPCWNQISHQKAARLHDCAKFVCFCAYVCHVMLMLITRVNILVLVLILMLASYV